MKLEIHEKAMLYRKRLGMGQKEFGQHCCLLSQGMVSLWETGEMDVPEGLQKDCSAILPRGHEKVHILRLRAGVKLAEAMTLTGLSKVTLINIEKGRAKRGATKAMEAFWQARQ